MLSAARERAWKKGGRDNETGRGLTGSRRAPKSISTLTLCCWSSIFLRARNKMAAGQPLLLGGREKHRQPTKTHSTTTAAVATINLSFSSITPSIFLPPRNKSSSFIIYMAEKIQKRPSSASSDGHLKKHDLLSDCVVALSLSLQHVCFSNGEDADVTPVKTPEVRFVPRRTRLPWRGAKELGGSYKYSDSVD